MKKYFTSLLLFSIFTLLFTTGALYNSEEQKQILSNFDKMILYQNKLASSKNNQSLNSKIHPLNVEMVSSETDKNTLLVRLIDNFFILDFYKTIVQFMRDDFQKKGMGIPFLSEVHFMEPFKCYVFKEIPEQDSDLNIENIIKTYESNSAIKHFDQQFRISIYRLSSEKGIMVIRGKYVFIDSNLNGIPDAIYMMNNYQNSKRNFINYLSLLAEGEHILRDSAYHSRFTDTLIVALSYISDHFPFERFLGETSDTVPTI